jgi:hypothetical protein
MSKPKCSDCKHFYITYDSRIPYGCKQFGFKCKDLPSKIVASAGQGECNGFEAKKKAETKVNGIDLNRKDIW